MSPASGFYGKLPCRGDFMQRRVPQEFVDAWDAWMQQCLHVSRQQLAERWLETYLTSPIWRFVLAPGVCGGNGYRGVMMPSVDRVGRYFPLVVLSPLPGDCLVEAACGAGRAWFDAAESLALAALEANDLDVEAFDGQVAALEELGARAELVQSTELIERLRESGFAGAAPQWHVPMLGDSPQRALNAFASIGLENAMRPCTLWWTQGSEAMEPGWLSSRGLPAPATFAALLSGEWRDTGWRSIGAVRQPPGDAPLGAAPERSRGPDSTALPSDIDTPTASSAAPGDIEILATHAPPRRDAAERPEPRFVVRPEIGLWGLVHADDPRAIAGAERIADVMHDLAPQATLTALVEETRRALQRARDYSSVLGTGDEAPAAAAIVGAVFLLARGAECAIVWIGAMQALSVRGDAATALLAEESAPPIPAVRYERLRPGDRWVLGSAAVLHAADAGVRHLTALDDATSRGAPIDAPPVLLLTVRSGVSG